ncbi:MAG: hypothetical protein RL272_1083 [Candidatus Parcubacteria bacterium]|jgi:S1-C subfamily serine protease
MKISLPEAQRPLFTELAAMTVEMRKLAEDGSSCGSGVVLTADGLIVGAWHVVTRSRVVRVRRLSLDRKRWKLWPYSSLLADVVYRDRQADIAVMKLRKPPADLVPAELAADDPDVGEALYRVGRDRVPLGSGYVYGYGMNMFLREFQVCMEASPGSSGGPVFTKEKALAGICLRYQPDEKLPPTAHCLPVSVLRSRILRSREVRDLLSPEDAERLLG